MSALGAQWPELSSVFHIQVLHEDVHESKTVFSNFIYSFAILLYIQWLLSAY